MIYGCIIVVLIAATKAIDGKEEYKHTFTISLSFTSSRERV
jgi:hypothetical protein